MPNAYTHQHPGSGWLSEPASLKPALSEKAPHPTSPSAPTGARPTHTLPAGGTTAGLPNPTPAHRPAGPQIVCSGTFCVNVRDRPRRGGIRPYRLQIR